ncbi:MAG: hypothetical protein JWO80_1810 [Bryobacterales bacterium]|nr:hypothetical protein [Bryobacterales bacterium]
MKAFAAALAATAVVLAARAFLGPFDHPFGMHSPMNAEGIFALLFVALLLLRANEAELAHGAPANRRARWLPAGLAALVILAFCRYLAFPLLADDYSHISHARNFNRHAFAALFTVPADDRFFRPAAYLSYALDAPWAGLSPIAWRTSNVFIHIANTLLVYSLCRKLKFCPAGAFFGALLFGIHASRPEAVTWVAARFDLLAVFFGLICILFMLSGWRVAAVLAMLLAAMSKESAYVIPLLAAAIFWYQRRGWREIARLTAPLFLAATAVFLYRWQLLGGIGGYQSAADGVPTVFKFRLASSLKALFPRFWATLLFPINWTGELSIVLACCFAAALAALVYLAWKGANRRPLLLGFLFATICSLPVHQFLSIGPDLEKARVLYFASIGLAIMFAAINSQKSSWIAAGIFLLFHFAALQHNLEIWKRTGYLAAATCRAGADLMRRPLLVIGLPNVIDGVYFLHTGYPDCVEQQSGRRPESILADDDSRSTSARRVQIWNAQTRKLEER